MSLEALTYTFVVGSFVIYIAIAFWSRASSTQEFYVAGGGVTPLANGMATAADWMSAASFLSMAGLIAFLGYGGSVYLMGWTGGYVLLALLLAPFLREFGKFTVPDFVGDRYYSSLARLIAVVCALFVSFTYIAGQMKGVGVAFSGFLGVDFNVGILIGMAIVFVYAVLGGMKGITYTQVAQYIVLIFAYTVPAIFMSIAITGSPVPQFGFIGIKFFNAACVFFASIFVYKIAKGLKFFYPILAPLFYFIFPISFTTTFSGFTEPLCALALSASIYLFQQKISLAFPGQEYLGR